MNDLAQAIEEARQELAGSASEFFPDTCDIYGPSTIDGGSSGDSVEPVRTASNVPLVYKGLGRVVQNSIGGETYSATHQLKMVRNGLTAGITPRHTIRVKPRGNTSELIFEKPFINEDSLAVFLIVNATLVVQGYQA